MEKRRSTWPDSTKTVSGKTGAVQIFLSTHSPFFVGPDVIPSVFKFQNNNADGIKIHRATDSSLVLEVKKRDNRSFFLRHRNLFFTDFALFVEGIGDYERYTAFCEINGHLDLPQRLFMMNGKDSVFFFEKLCKAHGIKFAAIVDRDFAFERSYWRNKGRKETIERLKQYCREMGIGLDADKLDKALLAETAERPMGGKREVEDLYFNGVALSRVKGHPIFVLKEGEVEDYLDKTGAVVPDNQVKKQMELVGIFDYVKMYLEQTSASL